MYILVVISYPPLDIWHSRRKSTAVERVWQMLYSRHHWCTDYGDRMCPTLWYFKPWSMRRCSRHLSFGNWLVKISFFSIAGAMLTQRCQLRWHQPQTFWALWWAPSPHFLVSASFVFIPESPCVKTCYVLAFFDISIVRFINSFLTFSGCLYLCVALHPLRRHACLLWLCRGQEQARLIPMRYSYSEEPGMIFNGTFLKFLKRLNSDSYLSRLSRDKKMTSH